MKLNVKALPYCVACEFWDDAGRMAMSPTTGFNEGTEKHTIFILILIKKEKSIRVFMILVDFLLGEI